MLTTSRVAHVPKASKIKPMSNPKILIVDDDQDIVNALDAILRMEGYEVEIALNGADCIGLVKASKPDLILLDLMLPDMHGREVAFRLRADKLLNGTPIVVMSASRDAQEVAQAIDATACIDKPFEVADLLKAVSEGLAN